MLAGPPGDQEGGGLYQPSLDYTGQLTGRPPATGFTGAGPLEGTHTHTHRLEESGADECQTLFLSSASSVDEGQRKRSSL